MNLESETGDGKSSIIADTTLRSPSYLRLPENFWMNLRDRYDLEIRKYRLAGRLAREVYVYAASHAK